MNSKLNTGILFLFSLFILISCDDLQLLTDLNKNQEQGYFSLAGEEEGRTIMPKNDVFKLYTLEFFNEGENENPVISIDRTPANLSGLIALNAGTWDLHVKAYMDEHKGFIAAKGNLNSIIINSGQTTTEVVPLIPVNDTEGEGVFSWNIGFRNYYDLDYGLITIMPLSGEGEDIQIFFKDGDDKVYYNQKDDITLNTGYYRVLLTVGTKYNSASSYYGRKAERREILHIYKNMESVFEFTFETNHFTYSSYVVTSEEDYKFGHPYYEEAIPGTLREVASIAWANSKIIVDSSVKNINLVGGLHFPENTELDGNGVIITSEHRYTDGFPDGGAAIYISGTTVIKRVWFKDIRRYNGSGGGIINASVGYGYKATIESCIFSESENLGYMVSSNGNGGAIYISGNIGYGDVEINGCTFYNNKATATGGAIHINYVNVKMTGNIFYANTAPNGDAVYVQGSTNFIQCANNFLDKNLVRDGNAITQSGFTITSSPLLDPATMKVMQSSPAYNVITNLPAGYPEFDFYGERIIPGASAGAVQGKSNADGYYLSLRANDNTKGSASVTSGTGSGGFYKGNVIITAQTTGTNVLTTWKVNGVNVGNKNPLTLNITEPTDVQAVFGRLVNVTSMADSGTNTLRWAIANSQDNDLIRVNLTAPNNVIELSGPLPSINKNLTIEGNGVIITSSFTFNTSALVIASVTNVSYQVAINRIWFKDLTSEGVNGTAICNNNVGPQNGSSLLTLESCIFSGNYTNWSAGAITTAGSSNIKACTFYSNSGSVGGAILVPGGTGSIHTMTGNIFYKNIGWSALQGNSTPGHSIADFGSFVISNYNVYDYFFDQSNPNRSSTNDLITREMTITKDFKVVSGSGADNCITILPLGYPEYDFYGKPITNGASAGAVQEIISGNGFYLGTDVSDSSRGSVNTPSGFYTGAISLTAQPNSGYALSTWIVNGVYSGISNPLSINITEPMEVQAVFGNLITVTSNADSGADTLRQAIIDAQDGDAIHINLPASDNTIKLLSPLPDINKSIAIEGNGAIITASDLEGSSIIQMRLPSNTSVERYRTISRIWFKNVGFTSASTAIIYNNDSGLGNNLLILESCIFSGSYGTAYGAIFNLGMMSVKGCTFYENSGSASGAIFHTGPPLATLTLTGNIFYGNTSMTDIRASNTYSYCKVVSNGYNVFENNYIVNSSYAAMPAAPNDIVSTGLFINHEFKILPGSKADGIITTIPIGYPSFDFYGAPITNGASAGAVQAKATGSGYYLSAKANNSERGEISVTPQNANSFYSGPVTITAQANSGFIFSHWVINGTESGDSNPLTLTLKEHTELQAFFGIAVTSDEDDGPGTFRQAITDMVNNDVIVFDLPAGAIITVEGSLPSIGKNVTIKGNGVTLTYSYMVAVYTPLLYIYNDTIVKINRVWFKESRGYSALNIAAGTGTGSVTLESCIFSATATNPYSVIFGAAISNGGTNLSVTGCTFYGNVSNIAGAIYHSAGTLTLAGNIFYGNTARGNLGNTMMAIGTINNKGYNIFDIYIEGPSGDNYDTLPVNINDKIVVELPFTNTTDFKPTASTKTIIPGGSWAQANMPTVDFYGTARDWTTAGAPGAVE